MVVARTTNVVEYGGERPKAAGGPRGDHLDLVVVEDAVRLREYLRTVPGLRGDDGNRNLAVRLVLPDGKRTVVCWFDASAPARSSCSIGRIASALRKDGERVRLLMSELSSTFRERLVIAVAKQSYGGSMMATHPIECYTMGSEVRGIACCDVIAAWMRRAADLENLPSNVAGPGEIASRVSAWARRVKKRGGLNATVLDVRALERRGFGLVLGVGAGGEKPPCVCVLEEPPRRDDAPTIVLIGKGVTYDSGGLALKPTHAMYGMHGDKTGAVVAAATLMCARDLGVRARLVAVLPCVENLVSERSVRPGDVLTAFDGTTVEVVNPDAEGRLILADALAYASGKYGPDAIFIDFATLTHTGAMVHPDLTAVYWTESDALSRALETASATCGELVWRMPPWTEYGDETNSIVADARNSGWATHADGYMAALFMRRFLKEPTRARWMHLDISKNDASPQGVHQQPGNLFKRTRDETDENKKASSSSADSRFNYTGQPTALFCPGGLVVVTADKAVHDLTANSEVLEVFQERYLRGLLMDTNRGKMWAVDHDWQVAVDHKGKTRLVDSRWSRKVSVGMSMWRSAGQAIPSDGVTLNLQEGIPMGTQWAWCCSMFPLLSDSIPTHLPPGVVAVRVKDLLPVTGTYRDAWVRFGFMNRRLSNTWAWLLPTDANVYAKCGVMRCVGDMKEAQRLAKLYEIHEQGSGDHPDDDVDSNELWDGDAEVKHLVVNVETGTLDPENDPSQGGGHIFRVVKFEDDALRAVVCFPGQQIMLDRNWGFQKSS
ncbi:hypothetical protein CEUSTIGMA_g13129.t1 [Chlamydomonas eustigma]|uniref:Cytosol aminopeptidase domain-containing protein n=1 Tax=Chlamydomonas eustigma TaxID=1157962 RepID=A0A250XRN1_9CHLO|nr:hypothetical protein CEUSTIGMA_g13129.t1 [Chlamydomonas eustigma]|eukprot:GAX85715.1 hypothetical protein CEUSTIGMA_g13129.t1 [Chlamydomonas eustigma]